MTDYKVLFVGAGSEKDTLFSPVTELLGAGWEVKTTGDSDEALAALDESDFDAVVASMKLRGMTGADLLKQIKEQKPGTLRIIVSEESDRDAVLQSLGYVHRCIALPYDPENLKKDLENSLGLQNQLSSEELRDRIAAIGSLPSPPEIYNQIVTELRSEDSSIQKVSDLVSQDIGITAKLLQMVNSSYFGLPNRIESVLHTINLLGLNTVQSIVLSASVFREFEDPGMPEISIESIYNRGMAVGAKGRLLAHAFGLNRSVSEDALMGGMLHDVGKAVLLTEFQSELTESVERAAQREIPLHEAEKEILGVTDAEIGAYLLSLWGLPHSIIEAVAHHYDPHKSPQPMMNATTAVHLAYALDSDEVKRVRDQSLSAVDMEYLTSLGIADQIPSFQNFCAGAVV